MRSPTLLKLLGSIVENRTQLEVYQKDVEHYAGPIREVREEGGDLVFEFAWRADYDHTDDQWHGAKATPPIRVSRKMIKIHRVDGKLVIGPIDMYMLTFHPPESPCVRQKDVLNLEIHLPVAA